MKNLSLKTIKVPKIFKKFNKYFRMIIFILYSLLIGIVIFYTNIYSNAEPTTVQVTEKKNNTSAKKIDEKSINSLKELESRNISLESLFDNGRINPFEN